MPFFKHKGHDGHKGKIHEIKTLSPFVYFVSFVVKLFPVKYGRPYFRKQTYANQN
jgi:hypothetical protein